MRARLDEMSVAAPSVPTMTSTDVRLTAGGTVDAELLPRSRAAADPRPSLATESASHAVQGSFDELDEPLRATTFVVVDLETTGGSAGQDGITEIGAVKVCGGEVLGEFQTLVDPERGITPFVSVLTGITDSMVIGAPYRADACCRRSSNSPAAACSSRTTPRSTSASCGRPATPATRPGPTSPWSTPRCSPVGC